MKKGTVENITFSEAVLIFPGRFQPFHNGHMSIIQKALSCPIFANYPIVIGIVINTLGSKDILTHALSDIGNEHHLPERNPIPLVGRVHMLLKLWEQLDKKHRDRLIITAIPRPELNWNLICAMFPLKRIWIVPKEKERFDEEKTKFFKEMGDQVARFTPKKFVNGYEIRKAMSTTDKSWEKLVPSPILIGIKQHLLNIKK